MAIIRNATANSNKQLVSVDSVDRTKTSERYGIKNNNTISSYTNVKINPNTTVSMNNKDLSIVKSKNLKIDPMGDLIKQTSEIIN